MFTIDSLLDDLTIKKYCRLNKYSSGTCKNFAYAMSIYCNMTGKTPLQLLEEAISEESKPIQLRSVGDYFAQLPDAVAYLAPKTQEKVTQHVMKFYIRNNIQLPYMAPMRAKHLKENFYIPSKDDIRKAMDYASPRNKAIILVQATSGMGLSEVLSLTREQFLKGVDKNGVVTWHVTRAKTGYDYTTFSSPEATRAIRLHLETHQGDSLWGITESTLMSMYQRLNERAGFESDGFGKIRSHNIRKWFNDTLRDAGCPVYLVDYWSGRKESETHAAYHTWKPERLKEEYIKYLPVLAIVEAVRVITNEEVMKELADIRMRMDSIQNAPPKEEDDLERLINAMSKIDMPEIDMPEVEKEVITKHEERRRELFGD